MDCLVSLRSKTNPSKSRRRCGLARERRARERRGFAAAQCGEAPPHRHRYLRRREAAPPRVEAQPRRHESIGPGPERRSLSALCGGEAAGYSRKLTVCVTFSLLAAFCL